MSNSAIYSDQLYNWSAHERLHRRPAPPPPSPGQETGRARASHPARLPHRALQALRPSRLQMPAGAGTRAQVLPVGQPVRQPTRNGLRPGGILPAGLRLLAQLPGRPPTAGEDLQYQPRVVTAPSQILTCNAHGAFTRIPVGSRLRWEARRQFPAELAASWLGLNPAAATLFAAGL